LHLLTGESEFEALMADLDKLNPSQSNQSNLAPWIQSSLHIKKAYIEKDEFDKGPRNLLNYGHTFGHAYESASLYALPHAISAPPGLCAPPTSPPNPGWPPPAYSQPPKNRLKPWFQPYDQTLKSLDLSAILAAIKHDKKNTRTGVNCILTRGPGR